MIDILRRLFPLGFYTDPIQRRRAIGTFTGATMVLLVYIGFIPLLFAIRKDFGDVVFFVSLIGNVFVAICALTSIILTRRNQQQRGAMLLMGSWIFNNFAIMLTHLIDGEVFLAIALLNIIAGALLISEVSVPYLAVTSFIGTFIAFAIYANLPPFAWLLFWAICVPLIIVTSALSYLFAQSLGIVARQVRATANEQRLRLAEASSKLTQQLLMTRLDMDSLLNETLALVAGLFEGISAVQIFLIDKDRRNATLVATTQNADILRGQQVGVGSLSVIGRVTVSGETVLVRANTDSQAYRRAAFLQGTRAEVAIPLRVGAETIGALDIQSESANAFGPEDTNLLETLANQIAIAIDNTRLYVEAQSQLAENNRLYERTRASLREIERLNQQLTGVAWTEYLRSQALNPAYTLDLTSGQVENAAELTPTLAEASRQNQVIIRSVGQIKTISLPISVRRQVIGAMEFEVASDQQVAPEQLAVLQQVVERMGLAAENARLLEDAQRAAQREAMINEISTRMQSTTSVENVISAATQSLADVIKADRVSIRLGSPSNLKQANGQATL